jgi:hypothetical protein
MCDIHVDGRMCYYTGYMCHNRGGKSLRNYDNSVIEEIVRVTVGWRIWWVAGMTRLSGWKDRL